jgi:putative hydrolase of the HAD superfamily
VDHVAVITNGDAAQQREKLRRTGLADRFAEVIISGDFGCSKPDPRIFQYACERASVNPSDAIHIGDSLTVDYEGACTAGLRGVLLVREDSAMPSDPSITTVRSLNELPSLVDGMKK